MNNEFTGENYVDHLDRIPFDCRKSNLRLATQTEQNNNQKKRKRNTNLPKDCGIKPDDIPSCVSYRKSDGKHGDCFEVCIQKNGERIFRKKTTRSKEIPLIEKLEGAKRILAEAIEEHPDFFVNKCINGKLLDKAKEIYKSYFEILKVAEVVDPIHKFDKSLI